MIGMACRFPGAANWREFWKNLVNDVESIHSFSNEELIAAGMSEEEISHPDFVNAGAVLKNKKLFDAGFFNYRPAEAKFLNPLHRVFHECIWEALEDAGYDPDMVKGSIGLYAGGGDDLNWKVYSMLKNGEQEIDNFTLGQLNNKDYLAALLAYKLNIKGPAFAVNTACSTSLVTISLACRSLLMGEIKMALAGGVSIATQQQKGYFYQEGMIDSRDGHCRAFDKDASGAVGGEGAGVVVLKRLQDALNEGDHIYAVIKGSAVNNDGNRKVGFTAPSVEGQADCIRKAMAMADVDPASISYVEAHGTGTRLGDPIEVEALNIAFSNSINTCAIGSVKTNIGHLDTAAGVAGLIKTALSLKYRKIPASLHFTSPNAEINFNAGPFYVNAALQEWHQKDDLPLRAGVSSFGIGGTNAHVILEEAPIQESGSEGRDYKLLTVSAKNAASLERYLDNLQSFLLDEPTLNMADLSYTLQVGRKHFAYRQSFPYKDQHDLLQMLKQKTVCIPEKKLPIVFMFPGQGSQYADMGKALYAQELVFRAQMDEGFSIIEQLTGIHLKEILFPVEENKAKINQTRYTQPVIFLLEYSLATLLMAWGITPAYMIGHSIGEYVAACLAGVFSFEDALKLVIKRGALMDALPGGSMLSVPLSEVEAAPYIKAGISLAAVNGPEQVVLSGNEEAVTELIDALGTAGIPYVKLRTSHAFHSAMLDAITDDFRQELMKVTFHSLKYPFISNLSGKLITPGEAASPDYWVSHMRETVKFSAGVSTLLAQHPELIWIEAGAGHTLSELLKMHGTITPVQLMGTAKEKDDGRLLTAGIGELWLKGIDIDWKSYYKNEKRKRVSLPTYAFEQVEYPVEVNPFENGSIYNRSARSNDWRDWIYYPVWKNTVVMPPIVKTTKQYLIFSMGDDFTELLKTELLQSGHKIIEVLPADTFRQAGLQYFINPNRQEHFHQLFSALEQEHILITDIIYAWMATAHVPEMLLEPADRQLNLVYFAIVKMVKALVDNNIINGKRFTFITNVLHQVTGAEQRSDVQSLALGLVNAVAQEHGVSCSNIDIDLSENIKETVIALMLALQQLESSDRIIALRHGKRWVQDYQRNLLPVEKSETVIEKEGVYLITGGLGDLGFLLAKHLLTKHQAKVVLTGRRSIEQVNGTSRLKKLQELSGTVYYYSGDVSDIVSLRNVVSQVTQDVGAIRGVIHAAGNIDRKYFELSEEITYEKSMAIFLPKIAGIRNLHEIFKDAALDFVWITSSLSSVLGGLTYGAYAAANVFMDHFVSSRLKELPSWKCIGLSEMALNEDDERKENARNRKALKSAEITALFEWSIGIKGLPLIMETIEDLPARMYNAYHNRKEASPENHTIPAVMKKSARPELSNEYVVPGTPTEETLIEIMQQFFGIEKIGITDNFFELGGDSLKAMMLLKRIKKEFNINFTMHDFFDTHNIQQMAAEIDDRLWLGKNVENKFTSII